METFYDFDYEGWDDFDLWDDFDDFDDYDDMFDDGDAFLRDAWRWLMQPRPKQSGQGTTTNLRRAGLAGAKAALTGGGTLAGTALGGLAGGVGAPIGGLIGSGLGTAAASLIPSEMDYFAALAAETDDEGEAEAFLGALIPMAARLLPQLGGAISRVAPQLIRGVANTARTLHSHPFARQLLRSMGSVVRQTGADIAGQIAQGKPLTGQMALRNLAKNTQQQLTNPQQVRRHMAPPRPARRRRPARPARPARRLARFDW